MTGYKAFRREIVVSPQLESNGFGIEIELTLRSVTNGYKFREIPLEYCYRKKGTSKIRYKDGMLCLLQLLSAQLDPPTLVPIPPQKFHDRAGSKLPQIMRNAFQFPLGMIKYLTRSSKRIAI